MFFSFGTSKIDFSKEVAKYLYEELKQADLDVKKDNVLIYIMLDDNEYLMIDCVGGKIYHNKDDEEKYFCMLGNFKNKTHLGEAYNCAIFNVKKIIKKIETLKNKELKKEGKGCLAKENDEEIIDLREDIVDLRKNSFILFINNALYEGKSRLKLIKEFFKKHFNITDTKEVEDNMYNTEYINKYGDAYKDDYNRKIYININSLINMEFDEFYDILKEQYPEFYIKNDNKILERIKLKHSQEIYNKLEKRAKFIRNNLLYKEDLYKNKLKRQNKRMYNQLIT